MSETKSPWSRWSLVGFAVGAMLWVSYARRLPGGAWGLESDSAFEGGKTLRFVPGIEQAGREHRPPDGETKDQVWIQTVQVVDSRVRTYGGAGVDVVPVGEDALEVFVPRGIDTKAVTDLVCQRGELQFRTVVRPSYAEYEDRRNQRLRGVVPGHPAPWLGSKGFEATAQGFEEFKARETLAFEAALKDGVAYRPSDPRYRVVPNDRRPGAPEAEPATYEVVEEPEAGLRFGGEILSNPRPSVGDQGHVVVFEIREKSQKAFGDWTGENVRLPLAIILNDRIVTAPQVNERLTTNVQITLGGPSRFDARGQPTQEEKAKNLAAVLQSGSLPVTLRLESVREGDPWRGGRHFGRGLLAVVLVLGVLALLSFVRAARRARDAVAPVPPPPPPDVA